MGGGFLLEGAVSSECEGTLTEAVHGVRLLAVGEQCLAGEGYVLADVANGYVEGLADEQHVGELGGCEYQVVGGERPLFAACNVFAPLLLGAAGLLYGVGACLDVITLYASAGHRCAVLREYYDDVFACHILNVLIISM